LLLRRRLTACAALAALGVAGAGFKALRLRTRALVAFAFAA